MEATPSKYCAVECKLLGPSAKIPTKAHETDAAFDLYSIEDKTIASSTISIVKTGIAISVPPGHYYTIESRSGLIKNHGIMVVRGIIDALYEGEILVALYNTSKNYEIQKGDRIAQIIFHRLQQVEMTLVQNFKPYSGKRGENGFGSSGR